jgi:hypothetical protein
MAGFKKAGGTKVKVPHSQEFALGSRPLTMRAPQIGSSARIKPAMPSQRNYGKPDAAPGSAGGGFNFGGGDTGQTNGI